MSDPTEDVLLETLGYLGVIAEENEGHDHPHAAVLAEKIRDALAALHPEPQADVVAALRPLMEAADKERATETARRKRYPRLTWEITTDRATFTEACEAFVRDALAASPGTAPSSEEPS